MTISTTESRISYNGNGVTTVFSFPYRFLANGDLVVLSVNAAGVETTKTLTTDYTVTGAGDDAGGSVTMLVAPAALTRLVIYRDTDIVQETDYISGDPFPAETHERALDRLTMIAQEIGSNAARAIKVPTGDPSSLTTTLPAAADRLDLMMQFNSVTGALEVTDFTVTEVNSAIAAAYAAGSTADAVTFIQSGAGAVALSVQTALRAFGGFPEQFGADGVDDTVAINKAIVAFDKVILAANKTYAIGTTIVPRDGGEMHCGKAILRLNNGANAHMFRAPDGVGDFDVYGGVWDGNKVNQSSAVCGFTSAGGGTNIRIGLYHVRVHDCYSHGVGWNSLVAKHFQIVGGWAWDNGASGFGTIAGMDRSTVVGAIAWDNATSNFGGSGIISRTAYAGIVGEGAGTADNLTSYGAGADFNTVASFVSIGGANNGMHFSGDYNAFAAIVIDSPAQYGLVSRIEDGTVVAHGLAMAGISVKSAGAASFWLDNNDGFAGVGLVGTSAVGHNLLLDTANTNGYLSGTMKLAGTDNVRLQAATDIVVHVMSADAVGDGIQIAESSKNVVGGRFTGNALGINETGTSDTNLLAGVSSTFNTSDTSIFANDASQVHASILGGTRAITAAATLDLFDYCDYFVLSGATVVTSIEASYAGRVVQIRSDGSTQINDGSNLKLSGNLTLGDTDCVVLVCDGTNWYQVSAFSNN